MKEPLQLKGDNNMNAINVLRIELVREIGNVKTYKITYEESESIETILEEHLIIMKMQKIFLRVC
mgnify:CR=1 FL=1